jgi:hypothetical protein
MHENRETSAVPDVVTGRSGKAYGQTPDMYAVEESDFGVVPMNQPNNSGQLLAEVGEGRPEIQGEHRAVQHATDTERSKRVPGIERCASKSKGKEAGEVHGSDAPSDR